MYLIILGWEAWIEIVDSERKLLDYYFCAEENHIWLWKLHILFNKRII